jgi:hypothetical protein
MTTRPINYFFFYFLFCYQLITKQKYLQKIVFFKSITTLLIVNILPLYRNAVYFPQQLTKFNGLVNSDILVKFFNRLQKQGKMVNRRVIENFLIYLGPKREY